MKISIILYICIFAAGVVVALLSANDNILVMCLGIVIAFFSLLASLLTIRDIEKLKKQAENAVYWGEYIGTVPDIDTDVLKNQLK